MRAGAREVVSIKLPHYLKVRLAALRAVPADDGLLGSDLRSALKVWFSVSSRLARSREGAEFTLNPRFTGSLRQSQAG